MRKNKGVNVKVSRQILTEAMDIATQEVNRTTKHRDETHAEYVAGIWLTALWHAFKNSGLELVVANGRGIEGIELDETK